jgi:hypothetical protein
VRGDRIDPPAPPATVTLHTAPSVAPPATACRPPEQRPPRPPSLAQLYVLRI